MFFFHLMEQRRVRGWELGGLDAERTELPSLTVGSFSGSEAVAPGGAIPQQATAGAGEKMEAGSSRIKKP